MQVDSYYQIVWRNLVFSNISFTIGFQKWIGYGDVKSLPVYFYVQRSSVFNATNTPITFDTARLNNGGAMNLTSGIFTAPRTGTYFFSFIAIAVFPTSSSVIQGATVALHLNGNPIGYGEAEDVNTIRMVKMISWPFIPRFIYKREIKLGFRLTDCKDQGYIFITTFAVLVILMAGF